MLRILAVKYLFLKIPNNTEKEITITIQYMKEINGFEVKIIGIKELMIETITYDCDRLLTDLDFKEKSIVDGIKLIETKLKGQIVSEKIINAIKRLLFNNISCEC